MRGEIQRNRIERFGKLGMFARDVVEGFITGLHKSPFHGFSVEFSEHRLYNPGESVRDIDWKLYGRTDRMYVKRYEEETNLRCQLVIDNSSSMYFPLHGKADPSEPNKICFSVYASAALVYLLRRQRDAVGLSLFSDHLEFHTRARSSTVHHEFLFHEMERLLEGIGPDVRKPTAVTDTLHEIAEKVHRRSLVVVFSDLFQQGNSEELFRALQHLRYNKHEVIVFNVVESDEEIGFNYPNRVHRFIDMESGETLKLNPSMVREEYRKAVADYRQEIALKCRQYRIELIDAAINQGFEQVLLPYLVKRKKMR